MNRSLRIGRPREIGIMMDGGWHENFAIEAFYLGISR